MGVSSLLIGEKRFASSANVNPCGTRCIGTISYMGHRPRSSQWCGSVQALVPPSTVRLAPVMYEDSGPATNDTRAATSSTVP